MRFGLRHPGHFAVMWRTDLLDGTNEELRGAGEAAFGVLLDAVRAAQAEGWAAHTDTTTLACFAWSTVHGLVSLWSTGSLRDVQEGSFDAVADAVLSLFAGLAPPHGTATFHTEGSNQ